MTDTKPALPDPANTARPALLVRTARIGLGSYRRSRDLGRLLRIEDLPGPTDTLALLARIEADCEARRRAGTGGYLPSVHVAVLTALLAEARSLGTADQAKASGIEALRSATKAASASSTAGSIAGF